MSVVFSEVCPIPHLYGTTGRCVCVQPSPSYALRDITISYGEGTYPLIPVRFLNGETQLSIPKCTCTESIGVQKEFSELKHLSSRKEEKENWIFKVAAEPNEKSSEPEVRALRGFRTAFITCSCSGTVLEDTQPRGWERAP